MISEKDLMIGNWVRKTSKYLPKDDVYEVGGCSFGGLGVYIRCNNEFLGYPIPIECVHPIEVTEGLIERMGFRLFDWFHKGNNQDSLDFSYKSWVLELGKFHVDVRSISNSIDRPWMVQIDNERLCSVGSGEFKYLHELQNIVRVITHEDLHITKEMIGYGKE